AGQDLGAADQQARIDAERPPDEPEHDDGADPQASGADRHAHAAAAAAFVAPILDVVAAAEILPAHLPLPYRATAFSPTDRRKSTRSRKSARRGDNGGRPPIVSIWLLAHAIASAKFAARLSRFLPWATMINGVGCQVLASPTASPN